MNNNAFAERRAARVERFRELAAKAEAEVRQQSTITHDLPGEIRIVENVELNRVQIFFPSIPPEEMRYKLIGRGFRWSRTNGAWQRHLNDYAAWLARELVTTDYR